VLRRLTPVSKREGYQGGVGLLCKVIVTMFSSINFVVYMPTTQNLNAGKSTNLFAFTGTME